MEGDIEVLSRAHRLFDGTPRCRTLDAGTQLQCGQARIDTNAVVGQGYRIAVDRSRRQLLSAARTDDAATDVMANAHRDRAHARRVTGNIVDEARADATAPPASPMAQREAMRRRAARLRTQRAHVLSARLQARRHAAALRVLGYRLHHRGLPASGGRAAIAVRAALSRLGRPYVWGASGPDQFDCSGLVQWAYAQAGLRLDRTTYQQINDGIPVPRSLVRPGDLVFPHAGHVQLAIGGNRVVEAPYPGAVVRISALGANVAVRRPS